MTMRRAALSGYRMMWLYVMFDLPVGTRAERKAATKFRHFLLDQGFEMAQFSVYLRFAESKEAAETHIGRVRSALPEKGKVHIVTITDKQYANARIFSGQTVNKGAEILTSSFFSEPRDADSFAPK